jgi:dimethylargininase
MGQALYKTQRQVKSMATVKVGQKQRALLRSVPSTYEKSLSHYFGNGIIDVEQARIQHAAYANALRGAGVEVTIIDGNEDHPDCIFVEDQAIVIEGKALLPIPGHESRVGEQLEIAKFLEEQLTKDNLTTMNPPAKMDGGDLLRFGDRFYVGSSGRTNQEGIVELRRFIESLGYHLTEVDIPENALHLTSISSTPSDQIILAPEGFLPKDVFDPLPEGSEVLWMPKEEVYGCNTIGFTDGTVLVAKGYPTVEKTLRERGFNVVLLEMSQIRAADGSLTCCSIFY